MKQPSKGLEFDGVDLLPYITGKKPADERPHETLHWRRDEDYALRIGDWKLTRNSKSGPQTIRLFDLEKDPGERHDLANVHPEKTQMMQDMFDEWDSQLPANATGKSFKNRNYDFKKGKRTNVADVNRSLQD